MGVIDFSKGKDKLQAKIAKEEIEPLSKATIEATRIRENAVQIDFTVLFDRESLRFALQSSLYTEIDWRLFEKNESRDGYYSFRIETDIKETPKATTERLYKLCGTLIRYVWIQESKDAAKHLTVAALNRPCHVPWDNKITGILANSKLLQVSKIIKMSRRKLVELPGMTTEYLFILEKNLARRGIFLASPEIEEYVSPA